MRDPTSPGRRLDAGRQPWPPLRLARAPRAEDLRAAPRWRSDSAQTSPTTRRVRAGADSGQRSSSPQRPPPLAVYAIAETGSDRRKPNDRRDTPDMTTDPQTASDRRCRRFPETLPAIVPGEGMKPPFDAAAGSGEGLCPVSGQ